MTDSDLFIWFELNHGAVWWDRRSKLWTCQVWYAPGKCVQPSRQSLRAAITDAHDQFYKEQIKHDIERKGKRDG